MTNRVPALDLLNTYAKLDPSGMRYRLRDLPQQCRRAWASSSDWVPPQHWQSFNKVVIGGMGGSAIAGDLLADLAALQRSIPIIPVRDFNIPFTLDEASLFIACSYSGTTEETLALFRQAVQQHASVLAITGGGELVKEARSANAPVLSIDAPGEPRSAVGYNLLLLLGALDSLGIVKTSGIDVQVAVVAALKQIEECNEEVPTAENPAKQLAQELLGKFIVVCGGGVFSALARRWKTQLNENAKAWAFFETIPELLHNSVEAFHPEPEGAPEKMVLVLQPGVGPQELQKRYRALSGLLSQGQVPHRTLNGASGPPLAELLSMLILGDYVSYYLALLQGLDPSPTPVLDRGKELLKETLE